jgi:glycerol kinase
LETTALGAAYLAGLAEGVFPTLQSIAESWQLDQAFTPQPTSTTESDYSQWSRAVQRSLNWASDSR